MVRGSVCRLPDAPDDECRGGEVYEELQLFIAAAAENSIQVLKFHLGSWIPSPWELTRPQSPPRACDGIAGRGASWRRSYTPDGRHVGFDLAVGDAQRIHIRNVEGHGSDGGSLARRCSSTLGFTLGFRLVRTMCRAPWLTIHKHTEIPRSPVMPQRRYVFSAENSPPCSRGQTEALAVSAVLQSVTAAAGLRSLVVTADTFSMATASTRPYSVGARCANCLLAELRRLGTVSPTAKSSSFQYIMVEAG